jgi:hypothetical protein
MTIRCALRWDRMRVTSDGTAPRSMGEIRPGAVPLIS